MAFSGNAVMKIINTYGHFNQVPIEEKFLVDQMFIGI